MIGVTSREDIDAARKRTGGLPHDYGLGQVLSLGS
jgi:hypothetical protein